MHAWHDDPASVRPMLATTAAAPLDSAALVYEPKYDGIRALVAIEPGEGAREAAGAGSGRGSATRRPRSFPRSSTRSPTGRASSIVRCSSTARSSRSTSAAHPVGFQNLQGRIHLKDAVRPRVRRRRAAFIAVRPAARRRRGPARAAAARAAGAARSAAAGRPRSASAHQRAGDRRRPRDARARRGARAGKA